MHEKLDFSPSFYSEIFSFLFRFVQRLVMTLKMVVLNAEFYSLSNGVRVNRDHRQKTKVFPKIPDFLPTSIGKPCSDSCNNVC